MDISLLLLPEELYTTHVFSHLNIKDIHNFIMSFKIIKDQYDNDRIWKSILRINYFGYHQYLLKYMNDLSKLAIKELLYSLYLKFVDMKKRAKEEYEEYPGIVFSAPDVIKEDKNVYIDDVLFYSCKHSFIILNTFITKNLKDDIILHYQSFSEACKYNNSVIMKNMFGILPPPVENNVTTSNNYSVYYATLYGHFDLFKQLLDFYFIDIDNKDRLGAVRIMKPPNIKHGHSFFRIDEDEEEEIDFYDLINPASKGGSLDIVKVLLDPDIIYSPERIEYSIIIASKKNHLQVVKHIISTLKDKLSDSFMFHNITKAFNEACGNGSYEVASYFLEEYIDYIKFESDYYFCIHGSCANGHTKIVRLLLSDKYKDRVDPRDDDLENSKGLYCALSNGDAEIVSLLLKDGRVNPIGENGRHLKVTCTVNPYKDTTECMKLLLDQENVKRYMKKNGIYILEEAISRSHVNIIKLLLDSDITLDSGAIEIAMFHNNNNVLYRTPEIGSLIATCPKLKLSGKSITKIIENMTNNIQTNIDYETPLHKILDYISSGNNIKIIINIDIVKNIVSNNMVCILRRLVDEFGVKMSNNLFYYLNAHKSGTEIVKYLLSNINPCTNTNLLIRMAENVEIVKVLTSDPRIPNNIREIERVGFHFSFDSCMIMLKSPTFTCGGVIVSRNFMEFLKRCTSINIIQEPQQMYTALDILKELKKYEFK